MKPIRRDHIVLTNVINRIGINNLKPIYPDTCIANKMKYFDDIYHTP